MNNTYYLHNGQLFPIDRMPPDMVTTHDAGCICRLCLSSIDRLKDFHAYLSTLQPIPHAFTGENRLLVEGKDLGWKYEVYNGNLLYDKWETVTEGFYSTVTKNKRKIAVPKEAKETAPTTMNRKFERLIGERERPDGTTVDMPTTGEPELPNLSASTANWSKIKDKDAFMEEVRGEESLLDIAKSMYESAKKLLAQLQDYGKP